MFNVLYIKCFQTVNKVLLAYADIVRKDFKDYTRNQKVVSSIYNVHFNLVNLLAGTVLGMVGKPIEVLPGRKLIKKRHCKTY